MSDHAIVVEGLEKSYGSVRALCGVDFAARTGSILGLLGPNGAGKTTAVRILATLLEPDGGSARVAGLDVVKEAAALRARIGLAGQYAAVDENLTGFENLEMVGRLYHMPGAEARKRADELLERFDLADAADRQARTYSGGMRRRLDLASSLLTRPRMLYLDEPTTGLDPRSRNQIWEVIRELVREGTTLLLTTQYLEEADQLTDRIAVIDHGRVIAEGTGDELKDSVGGQMIFVRLANPWDRERAIEALTRLGCGTPEPSELERELTLPAPEDGITMIERSAHALREAQIGVSDLGLRRPTLDDVFLTLTGAPATADGAGPDTGEFEAPAPEAAEARR
jgi:ABC-2 type transport system ATP-binding protein